MDVTNNFMAGRMNLDADTRVIAPGEYREAYNIRVADSEASNIGAIEKSLSNKQMTNLNFTGDISSLDGVADEFEEKLYWCVKDDLGCYVVEYDVATDTAVKVLEDTRAGVLNVLNFDTTKRVQMVIIIDTDNDNRLLLFTDNNTQPKCINIERAKTYGLNGFDEEDILLIKKPPIDAPTIVLGLTGNKENNIEEKFLRFAYRYKYLDSEYSALSPLSETAFKAKTFAYDFSVGTNKSMVNTYNKVDITFNTGSDLVTDIELVFKESGRNAIYLIESFNKADKVWADNSSQVFTFSNNKLYKVLPEKEIYRLYDNVPLKAKALEVIGNRLMFGNYTENFDIKNTGGDKITIDLTVAKITTAIVSGTATNSLKSNRDLEVCIAYLDDYGRGLVPLSSENNSIHIPIGDSINKNELKVTIASEPPAFATNYRFFVKQNKTDYETISPIIFYQDGSYRWVKLESADKDKVKEGDFLVVKSDSTQILQTLVKTKVLEVSEKEKNFLQPDDVIDEIVEKSGLYFKIKPENFRLNTDDFENFEIDTYHNARRRYHNPLQDMVAHIQPAVWYGDTLDDMVSGGTYTEGNNLDRRYHIQIDSLQTSATGSVELTGGGAGSVDSITVNGVNVMSGVVAFNTDLPTTATDVASNITSNTSIPDYTASAVGAVITITAVTGGTGPNGFVVVSSATTITTTDINMSGGAENTFRWSEDNGTTYVSTNVAITAGVPQNLSYGVQVTFTADTGHSLLDEWNIYACGILTNDDSRAYGWFRTIGDLYATQTSSGLTLEDEIIENGAVIDLVYDEWNRGDVQWTLNTVSGAQYTNIIEWFYKEDIGGQITTAFPGFDLTKIYFARGVLGMDGDGNANRFFYNTDGFMTMIVVSQNSQSSTKWVYLRAKTTLFQSDGDNRLLFETDPKDFNEDVYFEIGQTYPITANYHIGNGGSDIDQSLGVNAEIMLPFFNCFAWGNAFESYKIRDEYNANTMKIDTRPSTTITDYKQNRRIASLTYSGVLEQTTNYNALNEFNLALINYKDLDDKYGAINRIVSWNTDMDVYQEDKVHKVFYKKKLIYNQDGSTNLAVSDEVLNSEDAYAGEFGISGNGESLAVYGNHTYWTDSKRGVVCRKGQSGIEIISNFGMRDWFRDAFRDGDNTKILGGYDPYFDKYVVSINGYTLTFSERLLLGDQFIKGWTSFHSYIPDTMLRVNNAFFTIKDGELYKHNIDEGYNNFYGQQYSSSVTTVFNQEPMMDKIFKTIMTHSDGPWEVSISTNFANSTIHKNEFTQRESIWYAYIRKNENNSDLRGVSQGLGNITNILGADITFTEVPAMVSIGDSLYQMNGSTPELIGIITNLSSNVVTVATFVVTPVVSRFGFSKKDARIEGSEIRGYYTEVTLEDAGTVANELFAVSSNVVKSSL